MGLIALYCLLFLGSCSPIHCRFFLALIGLSTVLISYVTGFAICFLMDQKTAGVHQLIPFLLIGIGIDDIFVLCNAVDQTQLTEKPDERIRQALMNAGPSITITSLTNALAFYFGSMTSAEALISFCYFTSSCILMLYFTVMTVFLCVLVWDTRRVARKCPDCFCLCRCREISPLFCNGCCLSAK